MTGSFPRMTQWFAALLLAIIGLQAMPPSPVPVRVEHGSAFSASTVEVALPIRREATSETREIAKAPALVPQTPGPRLAWSVPVVQAHWPANWQTAPPPPFRPLKSPPAPRAPPIAT
ncbi:hypothetical protein [Tsuneonella suprasediminis]|uniref:hypothetical protein n=1 Tax=Tsuneonella suprasediminis TaxID=2306996 RepID=UPI002F94FD54